MSRAKGTDVRGKDNNHVEIDITKKQKSFISATQDEVLFGGAAGGGKSYGQLIDALLFALKYVGSKQLILRRTFPELDKSIIRTARSIYKRTMYTYNSSSHTMKFINGSIIDFGYCTNDSDVYQYQSAEYDVIRFDELTHFTEFQYLYLISRVRGANAFPKQVKSSTNPGGIGHGWVKARFIDPSPRNVAFIAGYVTDDVTGVKRALTRVFIPSRIDDNIFLMKNDPGYKARLENLPETEKRALLNGEWEIFDGQYFPEFSYDTHTIEPFRIPKDWRRYRALDYGLDCLAVYWIAIDSDRNVYVYKELIMKNAVISDAASGINDMTNETIYCTFAPPDIWGRSQESGKNKAQLFYENGLRLTKSGNDREAGWLAIKELLKIDDKGNSKLKIFRNCTELIRCLPLLQIDPRNPSDNLREPHEITHAPDALRAFAVQFSKPNVVTEEEEHSVWTPDMFEDYYRASKDDRELLIMRWGRPTQFSRQNQNPFSYRF